MSEFIDKKLWVEIFKATGLDEEMMKKWHKEFEKTSPDGHTEFLKWIKISDDEVKKIKSL